MKIACGLPYIFLCALVLYGCTFETKQMCDKRTTRSIFLGEHEESLSGVYIGDAFVSEHRLSFQQILQLKEPVTCESGEIVAVPPYEGLTWLDAMVYCTMIQSNSVARGTLKPGEIVRLPSVQEITTLAQSQSTCLWFFNGISNSVPPSSIEADAVYEWTSDINGLVPLDFVCVRHDPSGRHQERIQSIDALHAYPNLIMRLVIAPEDERAVKNRDIAMVAERMIWNLARKQHYHMLPYRNLDGTDSNDATHIGEP